MTSHVSSALWTLIKDFLLEFFKTSGLLGRILIHLRPKLTQNNSRPWVPDPTQSKTQVNPIGLVQKLGLIRQNYRKVASSSLSRIVAHFQIFRSLMKGKFDAYVLWPLAKKFQNWIVDRSTALNFTVHVLAKILKKNWLTSPSVSLRLQNFNELFCATKPENTRNNRLEDQKLLWSLIWPHFWNSV